MISFLMTLLRARRLPAGFALARPARRLLLSLLIPALLLPALLLPALLLLAVSPRQAAAAEDERPWQIGLALGAGKRGNPLVNAEDIDINAVIDFSWYGERFFFDNGDFGFLLHEGPRFAMNLVATDNNERRYYDFLSGQDLGLNILSSLGSGVRFTSTQEAAQADSSLILISEQGGIASGPSILSEAAEAELARALADSDVAERDFAVNGGLEFLYLAPWGDFQAQLLTDVSTTHGGEEAWLSYTRPWYFASRGGIDEVALTLGLEWKSADLVGYYYGVRPDEVFPGRPAYEGGSGANTFVRLSASHALSRHWKVVAMLEREFFSDAIRESPIVTGPEVDTFFLGLYYGF